MNLNDIKLVSWDLDGTLYRIRSLYIRLGIDVLRAAGRGEFLKSVHELAEIGSFRRRYSRRSKNSINCHEVFAGLDRAHIQALERKWLGTALTRLSLPKEVGNALNEVRTKKIRQIVLSNFTADYKVRALGLQDYFDEAWACEEMTELKPSPEPFRAVQRHYGILPSEHLHIGDRDDTDGGSARLSGCRFVNVNSWS